jgi:feruloyl esterase
MPDPTTVIVSAIPQPASAGGAGSAAAAAARPAHCEVLGKLQERRGANDQTYAIKFHLRLPAQWNGKLFFQGGGGSNGVVGDALGNLMGAQPGAALALGYAVVSQDSGHDNAVNNDPRRQGVVTFGWDAEARRNYGGASIGPVVRAAKALARAFYGRAPGLTYYVGGSKGGQEAMMAAQRFPKEFDAVLVGYPGFRLAHAGAVGQMWDAQAFAAAARSAGQTAPGGAPLINRAFSDEDLLLASGAVLKACDNLDGTVDGMVENFTACTTAQVAPALAAATCAGDKTPACLAPAQVAALRKVFDGARGRDGRLLYADWPWDAGIAARTAQGVTNGWRAWKIGPYASGVNTGLAAILGGASASAVFTSPPTSVADDPAALTGYALAVDVEDNAAKVGVKWGAFDESAADFMSADAVDLTPFTRRGGKMLIYHGVSDPVFSINDTIGWLKRVDAAAKGKAADFVRLFAVPGMNHGGGGPSTDQFDAFGALVAWRERGVAPTQLVATARAGTPWPGRTRLLCPYPQRPQRTGTDIETAASFRCAAP